MEGENLIGLAIGAAVVGKALDSLDHKHHKHQHKKHFSKKNPVFEGKY